MKREKNKRRKPSIFLTIKGDTSKKMRKFLERNKVRSVKEYLTSALRLADSPLQFKNTNRQITVSADMFIQDYEWFGSNEYARRQQTNSAILSTQGIAQTVMDFEVRMGGEIRVEFHVTAQLWDSSGLIVVNCEVKLFEGTSESTDDLDGQKTFQLNVPPETPVNHFVRVNNDDENDDDYVTIAMTFTNNTV